MGGMTEFHVLVMGPSSRPSHPMETRDEALWSSQPFQVCRDGKSFLSGLEEVLIRVDFSCSKGKPRIFQSVVWFNQMLGGGPLFLVENWRLHPKAEFPVIFHDGSDWSHIRTSGADKLCN